MTFQAIRGRGLKFILFLTALYNALIILLLFVVNSYELTSIFKVILVIFNIYQLYYIALNVTLKYKIDDNNVYIEGLYGLKRVTVPLKSVKAYKTKEGKINGTLLYGYGKDYFALGKSKIEDIGVTHMFVTSNEKVVYINTEEMNYGISPSNYDKLIEDLNSKGITNENWYYKENKNTNLYKNKRFIIPLIIGTIIILIMTLTPFILYLFDKLPSKIPLKYDANFEPVIFGSGKQFAFKQMVYGALNMALMVCLYYASYFYAKYDKKIAYRIMYISVITSAFFLVMQGRILISFR